MPSLVLFMVLMTLGYVSFGQLAVTRFPNIDVPIVQVRVYQSGAAPSELEVQVTKKIEDAIAGVNGVKHQTSAVTEGSSITTIEFRLEVNQDRALNDVKDAIARIRAELPRTIDEPIVTRIEIEGLPIVTYGARAPGMTPEELSWFVDDVVVRALQGVKAVSQIERFGGVEREIRVSLDPDRLLAFGITAGDVNRQLRATNVDLAGGRGEIAGREQAIRTLAGKQSVADLAATAIVLPRGRKVRLDELGSVTDSTAEPRTFAALDGRPVVAFAISRAKGASDVVVAADVAKKIAELQKAHPNVELKLIDSMVVYTLGAYHSTMKTLIEGAILAIAVVFIFLRDWRATLDRRHRLAALDRAGVLGHRRGGLLAQPRQPARHHHRHRHPGRRCDRRDREHRAPHAHGQIALPRGARGRRRDRPRRHRHHLHHHRRVRAGELHGRHRRPVLQAVRPGRRLRRVLLAAGGAPRHAAARRLLHARLAPRGQGRLGAQGLHAARALVGGAPLQVGGARPPHLRRLDRQLLSPPLGLPARRGQRTPAAGRRAAARLAHRRDARP